MTLRDWTGLRIICKCLLVLLMLFPAGCSTNPATGESQFTPLMTPAQEEREGAWEHEKVMLQFGGAPDKKLQAYIATVGQRVTANTERPEVKYRFFVLDTPTVNAFALPGGYIYVTRGLLAQANSEGQLAAVLAHETGHITARHAATAYSKGMITAMGAAIVAAGTGGATMAQMADMGSDIFTQAYSRSQESEADRLGIRYLSRAGYDPMAMAEFLGALEAHEDLQRKLDGNSDAAADFFDTHPGTADRIAQAKDEAAKYPAKPPDAADRDRYLAAIDGVAYGDSDRQGFTRGNIFWHPQMGFTFTVPEGFTIENQPSQVVAKGQGAIVILDTVAIGWPGGPASYLRDKWMAGEKLDGVQDTIVTGMKAATASFAGRVGGRPVTILIAAIQWAPDMMFRFQIAVPQGSSAKLVADVQQMIRSLRRMTDAEKRTVRPWRIQVVTAQAGDSATSLAARMPFDKMNEERFRVLNGLKAGEQISAGRKYKIVTAD